MTKKCRSYSVYLDDMLSSMHQIRKYTKGMDFEEFKNSRITIDAVIRNFEIIGEASKHVPDSLKEKYPALPWKQMYGLRNYVTHEYFGIDLENIWEIITNNLPENIEDLSEIIKNEKSP